MVENVPFDEKKPFAIQEPDVVINTSISDISISAVGPDGIEHENVYPEDCTSDTIALSTAADLNVPATPFYQEAFVETLDDIRNQPYLTEFEFELKGPEFKFLPALFSLKVKFKRGLKVIKSYKKESSKDSNTK